MNEDTAAQAVAAASAEGSKDWMHELWQRLQAVGPGLLGRLGGERLQNYALGTTLRTVLAQRHDSQPLVDAVRAVQTELKKHAGLVSPLNAIDAYLYAVRPQQVPLAAAIAATIPPSKPPSSAEAITGGDTVTQRLAQIIHSKGSSAIQSGQLSDLRSELKPRHYNVVKAAALIMQRATSCRRQFLTLNAMLRALEPPKQGTIEHKLLLQTLPVFQRAVWAPLQKPKPATPAAAAQPQCQGSGAEWTAADDEKLWNLRRNGLRWPAIASKFPGRTESACISHFRSLSPDPSNPSSRPPRITWQEREAEILRNQHRTTATPASAPPLLQPPAGSALEMQQAASGKRPIADGRAAAPAQRQRTTAALVATTVGLASLRTVGALSTDEGRSDDGGAHQAVAYLDRRMLARGMHATLVCANAQMRTYVRSLFYQLLARLLPYGVVLAVGLLSVLLMLCDVRHAQLWHARALLLLVLYRRHITPARIEAGVRLAACMWRCEWVGAVLCAVLLACTIPWPAIGAPSRARLRRCRRRVQECVSWLLCAYRVAALCHQLVDSYVHAPAAPSVDELLELASNLLAEGLQLLVLHLLLQWQAKEQTRLGLWLAGLRVRRVAVRA